MQLLMIWISLMAWLCPVDGRTEYRWSNVTPDAGYPQSYNYPVFSMGGWMVAMNNGAWMSKDGRRWTKMPLPDSGLNSAYQKYAYFNGAVYALGKLNGNYQRFSIDPRIMRTKDLQTWEVLAERSNLPQRIFYGLTVFDEKIWIVGGYDGKRYLNDVWNSADGVNWVRVTASAPWSPRTGPAFAVFKGEMWLLGGGVIDGDPQPDKEAEREVWASPDGKNWRRVNADLKRKWRGTPVVFDGKLLLVGANRGGTFESAVWMTEDGTNWRELAAPWSPRGGVAAWVFDGKLFMTGGKSSHTENGEIKFVYSNDVWVMERRKE